VGLSVGFWYHANVMAQNFLTFRAVLVMKYVALQTFDVWSGMREINSTSASGKKNGR